MFNYLLFKFEIYGFFILLSHRYEQQETKNKIKLEHNTNFLISDVLIQNMEKEKKNKILKSIW